MTPYPWTERLLDFLSSPANLTGLALASLALLARLTGIIDAFWLLIVAGSYGLGWQMGRLAFSHRHPHLSATAREVERLSPVARTAEEREDIAENLDQILRTVNQNTGARFDPSLQHAIRELCAQVKELIARMETSAHFISAEDAYSAKRIALDYLPGLIDRFITIPKDFATRKVLADGKTARELLQEHLAVLQRKTAEMSDDLASQDARSFLNHTQFLKDKFEQQPDFIGVAPPKPKT